MLLALRRTVAEWRFRLLRPEWTLPLAPSPRVALLVSVLAFYVWQDARYIPVWESNPTLWQHAHEMAPLKPRPAVNLAKALILRGDLEQADRWLSRALGLAEQPHVPQYDRQDAILAVTANLQTTAIIRAVWATP